MIIITHTRRENNIYQNSVVLHKRNFQLSTYILRSGMSIYLFNEFFSSLCEHAHLFPGFSFKG